MDKNSSAVGAGRVIFAKIWQYGLVGVSVGEEEPSQQGVRAGLGQ